LLLLANCITTLVAFRGPKPRDDHFVLRIDVIDDVIEKYLESMHETCIANDLSCGIDLKLSDASVLSCDCDTHS